MEKWRRAFPKGEPPTLAFSYNRSRTIEPNMSRTSFCVECNETDTVDALGESL